MSTQIRKAGICGLRPVALGLALGLALMLWSVALAHADVAPTATALQCTPESAKAGQPVQCTAFVKGVVGKGAAQVLFKSEQGGQFSGNPCKLGFDELGIASCSVEYTPPEGVSSDRIHAIFSGNEASDSSEDIFTVTILGGGKDEGGGEDEGGDEGEGGGKDDGGDEGEGGGKDQGGDEGEGGGKDQGGKDQGGKPVGKVVRVAPARRHRAHARKHRHRAHHRAGARTR
jgi:hypothetical protein